MYEYLHHLSYTMHALRQLRSASSAGISARAAAVWRSGRRRYRHTDDRLGGGRDREARPPFLVTTPIFYVNADPHIGHLHSALLADATARWHRIAGNSSVMFTTGTDEHGIKVQEAAEAAARGEDGVGDADPKRFCDRVSSSFRDAFDRADIHCDRFVRTTDEDHAVAVDNMWRRMVRSGDLYMGTHEGWYCSSDEIFVPENMVEPAPGDVHNGNGEKQMVSSESGRPLRWVSEENWKFRLSAYEDRLLEWLEGSASANMDSNSVAYSTSYGPPVRPSKRLNEVRQLIKGGLHDISVSRLRSKVPWALPVPDDDRHSIYVWVDALTNYLTVTGFGNEWG